MRTLKYRLENGTIVNLMSQAKASGQKYEVFFEEIRETNRENISPIRKAMLEQFGYVHPSLKDKVVLDQRRRPLKQGRFFYAKTQRRADTRVSAFYYTTPTLHLSRAKMHKFFNFCVSHFVKDYYLKK